MGLGLLAVVEETAEAEGGLDEKEEDEGEAEALMRGVEFRVFVVVDGVVDAEGEADQDEEDSAALADDMYPEGMADGEAGQERAEGKEDHEAGGHDDAVDDRGEASVGRILAVHHAAFGG